MKAKPKKKPAAEQHAWGLTSIKNIEIDEGFNTSREEPVDDLVASFKEVGMENPIHVRQKGDGKLYLIDGHRRYQAALKAGLKQVKVIDHGQMNDVEAKTLSYRQNLLRRKPTKKEQLDHCRFFNEAGLTVTEIARRMCIAKSTASEYLSIATASPEIRKAASKPKAEGGIPKKAAVKAAQLPKEEQRRAAPKMAGKTLSESAQMLGPRVITDRSQVPPVTQNLSVLMPGESLSKEYRMVSDYRERCQKMEIEIKKRLRENPTNAKLHGMELVIGVLKGQLTVEQAFINWQKV